MDDQPGSQFSSGDADTYGEDRRRRLRRDRLVGFVLTALLWAVALVPLVRESLDGREGAGAVAVVVAVAAITLGVAAAIRGVYVVLRKHRFWSPWIFALAAVVALVGYFVQSAGEEVVPIAGTEALESRES